MLGTVGLPAGDGVAETCVEEVGARLADRGHRVVVYCPRPGADEPAPANYRGMTMVRLGAPADGGTTSVRRMAIAVGHLLRHRTDAVIVFGPAGTGLLPVLRAARLPFATHVGGPQWQGTGRASLPRRGYRRMVRRLAAIWSPALIADSAATAKYLSEKFSSKTDLIGYGARTVRVQSADRIARLDLEPGSYHLVVSRFQLVDNLHLIVDGYRRSAPKRAMVVVGAVPATDTYTRAVLALAGDQVRFLGDLRDQELLDELYAHAVSYLHGRSSGATDPALLRALGAGLPVTAFDVAANREVLGEDGWYFRTAADVALLIGQTEDDDALTRQRGEHAAQQALQYDWDDVTDRYEALCRKLIRPRPAVPAAVNAARITDEHTAADRPSTNEQGKTS